MITSAVPVTSFKHTEEIQSRLMHYPYDLIPAAEAGGVAVRVIMRSAFGLTSPVEVFQARLHRFFPLRRTHLSHAFIRRTGTNGN